MSKKTNQFAKLYTFDTCQLIVRTYFNNDKEKNEVIFITQSNGLQIKQTVGFPVDFLADSYLEIFDRRKARKIFNNLQGIEKGDVDFLNDFEKVI
jgi:hypothetical protein